jgi:hypothetical protein
MPGLLDAYRQNIGDPFAQLVGGAGRGFLGLGVPAYANSMGMDAYRTGQALSNMPGLGAPAGLLKAAANAPDALVALGGLLGKAGVGKLANAKNLPMDEAARATRMNEMGLERGWYRAGGKIVDGKRNGNMYTQDQTEAAGYLRPGGDLREYAIPKGPFLHAEKGYSSRLAHNVANVVDNEFYGKQGEQLAKELRTYGPNEGLTGGQLWQSLEARFGNDGAAEILEKLGDFSGAKGFTRADEAYVFPTKPVRDASKAVFDPSMKNKDNIYGKIDPMLLFSLGLGSGGAALASSQIPGLLQGMRQPVSQDKTTSRQSNP